MTLLGFLKTWNSKKSTTFQKSDEGERSWIATAGDEDSFKSWMSGSMTSELEAECKVREETFKNFCHSTVNDENARNISGDWAPRSVASIRPDSKVLSNINAIDEVHANPCSQPPILKSAFSDVESFIGKHANAGQLTARSVASTATTTSSVGGRPLYKVLRDIDALSLPTPGAMGGMQPVDENSAQLQVLEWALSDVERFIGKNARSISGSLTARSGGLTARSTNSNGSTLPMSDDMPLELVVDVQAKEKGGSTAV